MNPPDLDEHQVWSRYQRYPYLLAKFVFFALLAVAIWSVLRTIESVLLPVLLALMFAYLLDPSVDWFEERGFSRTTGIGLFLCVGAAIFAMFVVFLYPTIAHIMERIVTGGPHLLSLVEDQVLPWAEETLGIVAPHSVRELSSDLGTRAASHLPELLSGATRGIGEAWTRTGAVVSSMLNLVLIPILTFYFLRDFDRMKAVAANYLPVQHREGILTRLSQMDQVIGAWMRGQLEVAVILGGLYSFGLGLTFGISGIGVTNGVAIGMVGGLLNIIPYFGFLVGFLTAVLLTLLDWTGWGTLVGVFATFAVAQSLEGYVVTPRIVGEKVGLSPVVVIIALLLGAETLGLLGMLLAIPVVGSVGVLLPDLIATYRRSDLYLGEFKILDRDTVPPAEE